MEPTELKTIIDDHELWIKGRGGRRADFSGANLIGANLAGASLKRANLDRAIITGVDLTKAFLGGARLECAIR